MGSLQGCLQIRPAEPMSTVAFCRGAIEKGGYVVWGSKTLRERSWSAKGSRLFGNFTLPQRGPTAMDKRRRPRGSSRLLPLRRGRGREGWARGIAWPLVVELEHLEVAVSSFRITKRPLASLWAGEDS